MLNNQRDLVVQDGLEVNLGAALLRNSREEGLPRATLLVRYLRIDEEITVTGERRRLQLEAALEVAAPDGEAWVYGPLQVSEVKGGLEVTDGHAGALASSLSELLHELDAAVREGRTGEPLAAAFTAPADLPDGAYYSVADFRAGRVDTSVHLAFVGREIAWLNETGTFYEAEFIRPEELSRRDFRELWGYQHEGTSYLYLQRNYYSIQTDKERRTYVAIPGGVVDVETRTKQAAIGGLLFGAVGGAVAGLAGGRSKDDLYTLDLVSGALAPQPGPVDTEHFTDRILVHHVSPAGSPDLVVQFNGKEYELSPGAYTVLDTGGSLGLSTPAPSVKPLSKSIWTTEGKPAVYTVEITEKGRIELTRGSTERAEETARGVASAAPPVAAR